MKDRLHSIVLGAALISPRISRCVIGSLVLLASPLILFSLLASKPAQAVQPPLSALDGTWVNTQSNGLIAEIVINSGSNPPHLQAHVYGFCSPSPCDWGTYGAAQFSQNVVSNTAFGFRVTISSSTDKKIVQGHLTDSRSLEITTQISYPQGGPNNDYEVTEEFQLQGSSGGLPPSVPPNPAIIGTWTAVKSYGGLTHVIISESGGTLQIHPFGSCSPTDCDWGVQPASQFSDSPASSDTVGFQSSIAQGFASRFLQGHLILSSGGETLLEITDQTTFEARDHRYDYELTEDFELATGSPTFSMSPASSSLNVTSGGEATDDITITPMNGSWDSVVQLSCSVTGTSPMPTCSLSKPSVTPGSNAVTSTLIVNMPTMAAWNSKRPSPWVPYTLLAPFALGLAFAGSSDRRRKSGQILCLLLVLATVSIIQSACGGGASNNSSQKVAGPYTVDVKASSGKIQLGSQIMVTVQ